MSFVPLTYLLDFSTPDFKLLEDPESTLQMLEEITVLCGFQVVARNYKKFDPQGLTAMLLLAESHISIHTWPEKALFCMDIFTCKGKINVPDIVALLQSKISRLQLLHIEEVNRISSARLSTYFTQHASVPDSLLS